MTTYSINDFAKGWDMRKGAVGASPNSLRVLDNAFVNAGGEIEKRKAHPVIAPQSTLGLYTQIGLSGAAYPTVFGPPPTPAGWYTHHPAILYQEVIDIQYADRVLDVAIFNGQFYVVSRNSGGIFNRYGVVAVNNGLGSRTIHTHRSKLYCISPTTVFFSSVNDPTVWSAGTNGAGFITVDTQDIGYADLRSLETYYNQLALIGRNAVQLWNMTADPQNAAFSQVVSNIGCLVTNGVARVGDGDLLMLHDSGVRSLRARSNDLTASVTDTGSPIDAPIKQRIRRDIADIESGGGVAEKIAARVEPTTGQFWLFWDREIFVLSRIPGANVLAWSRYTVPNTVEYAAAAGGRLWYKTSAGIHLVGGQDDAAYDSTVAEVVTPFIDAESPTQTKRWLSFDIAAEGTWTVEVCTDPLHPDAWMSLGTITGPSYSQQRFPMVGQSTHIAFRFRSVGTGPARIGAIHMEIAGGEKG